MGNRSYLYLVSSSAPAEGFREIAEANNNFPVLWQILLAGGDAVPAIDYQRVFGNNDTDNLASDAHAALLRVRALGAAIRQHPLRDAVPELEVQFEALEQHLAELIAAADGGEGRVLFSANLDQLSWLDGEQTPEQFIHQCRRECDECWAGVDAALQARNFPALDEALGLNQAGNSFGDWATWAWSFGLGGLQHDYFSGYDAPRLERFADFVPEERDNEGLEYDCRRLLHEGKVGLQRRDANGDWKTLLEAEWDAVDFATYDAVWLRREGLVGYAVLGDAGADIRLAPQLDSVDVFFDDGGGSCAIVGRAGRQGFLRADGSWLFEPAVDEVWRFVNGFAPFSAGGCEGFIDAAGRIAIPARYDWVGSFSPGGVAPVNLGEHYGLVRGDGEIVLPLIHDGIEWNEALSAFEVALGDRKGLWHGDGTLWLAIEWEGFKPLAEGLLLGVQRNMAWGACDGAGVLRIAPDYTQLEAHEIYTPPEADPPPIRLLARRAGKLGLLDENGAVLVPLDYQRCDDFNALDSEARRLPGTASLWRVSRKSKGRSQKFGAYDCSLRREVVACQYDRIEIVDLGEGEFCYLAANDNPKAEQDLLGKQRIGILNADGTPLFALDYAWLCSPRDIVDGWSRAIVAKQLKEQWRAGLPIQAVRSESGLYVWLARDGREIGHAEHLARRFAAGDLASALMLGRQLRDGEGIVADQPAARGWLARAAGASEALASDPEKLLAPPPAPSSPGLMRRLADRLGGARPAAETPTIAQAAGLYAAMFDLSKMLHAGEGGPASPGAARFWLEMAGRAGGEADDCNVMAQLGYFLCNGIGGAVDTGRGIALYRQAAERRSNQACYNLGIIYEWGQGVEADLAVALDYYRQSERLGDPDAAYAVGRLLRAEAEKASAGERRKRLGEAAYFLTRALDDENCDFVGPACLELALIRLDPDAPESDAAAAEALLLRGAELDEVACIELLLEKFYGLAGGPRQDSELCQAWQARLAALQAARAE